MNLPRGAVFWFLMLPSLWKKSFLFIFNQLCITNHRMVLVPCENGQGRKRSCGNYRREVGLTPVTTVQKLQHFHRTWGFGTLIPAPGVWPRKNLVQWKQTVPSYALSLQSQPRSPHPHSQFLLLVRMWEAKVSTGEL